MAANNSLDEELSTIVFSAAAAVVDVATAAAAAVIGDGIVVLSAREGRTANEVEDDPPNEF